jgi:hypothetical protein
MKRQPGASSNDLTSVPDDDLGRLWAARFSWYLMEMQAGNKLLTDEEHQRIIAELKSLEAQMKARGLPAWSGHVEAFEIRELLPEDDLNRLSILTYGRVVEFKGLSADIAESGGKDQQQ